MKLSVVLATYNEEENIKTCLDSVKGLADEIIVVDGKSTDKTAQIARELGARVISIDNNPMFHINKQKALDEATGDWILQLDADEQVSPELATEIKKVIAMSDRELKVYEERLPDRKLFLRHEQLSSINHQPSSGIVAFNIPRLNFFLGRFLRHGGVYPDPSIRLIRKGKARFPMKDLHEIMEVDGGVGWLQNPLLHYDSPTFKRYIDRNDRYVDFMVTQMRQEKLEKNFTNFMNFLLYKPFSWFFSTTILHKSILDGWQGIVFSFFSALRFPKAYMKYVADHVSEKKNVYIVKEKRKKK